MELNRFAYRLGQRTADIIIAGIMVAPAPKVYRKIKKIAKLRKIRSHVPAEVTENVFECLQYLD